LKFTRIYAKILRRGADKLRQLFFESQLQAVISPPVHVKQRLQCTNANSFVAKVKNAFASLSLAPALA